MPASAGCGTATELTAAPSPVTRLITPGGSPAASNSRIVRCAASCWVGEGFHTTTLPSNAGAAGRLPAIAVKLNGVIARTKPSSGRKSIRFHTPVELIGCCSRNWRAKCTLKRRKSASSQAASISACCTVFDCPSMVAALSRSRQVVESRSAARRNTAARSSKGSSRQAGAAVSAAPTAASTSASVACAVWPSTSECRCGATTSRRGPPAMRCTPPTVMVSSAGLAARSSRARLSAARSGEPGA